MMCREIEREGEWKLEGKEEEESRVKRKTGSRESYVGPICGIRVDRMVVGIAASNHPLSWICAILALATKFFSMQGYPILAPKFVCKEAAYPGSSAPGVNGYFFERMQVFIFENCNTFTHHYLH
jgi:hypothetical protein